jgi:ATP-dependent RNA helicase DeaD
MVAVSSKFGELGLAPDLLDIIDELGYEEPTPIQSRAIPTLLRGNDLIAQAQTGSGKTAAFALPAVQNVDIQQRDVQVLVMAPTRELAVQVAEATHRFGGKRGVSVVPVYGGQPIDRQLRALRFGAHVVVGTPGRLLDHLRRGSLVLDAVKLLVLDEADEMLDMGFIEDIEEIMRRTPESRQTALFSATIPPNIQRLARNYMHDPENIAITAEKLTIPLIEQRFVEVSPRNKLDALTRLLDVEAPQAAMIFCRTRREVDDLGEALVSRGYAAEAIHGDLSQTQRDRVMARFRSNQAELLVATDVAARGLDIDNVTHVFNYDIPEDSDAYVHRIGRTGRAGRSGTAITLVVPREQRLLRIIERSISQRIQPMRIPTLADVAARRVELLQENVREAVEAGGLEQYRTAVENLADAFDLGEIAAAAFKLLAERDGRAVDTDGENDISLPPPAPERSNFAERAHTNERFAAQDRMLPPERGRTRLFVEVGRRSGLRPGDLVGAIANEARVPGSAVGSIDIYENFTFVEVDSGVSQRIMDALARSTIRGQRVKVSVARPRG